MSKRKVPFSVDDVLMHIKNGNNTNDSEEHAVLPITRYKNIMSAPNIVEASNEIYGAPYVFLKTGDTVELPISKIRELGKDSYII